MSGQMAWQALYDAGVISASWLHGSRRFDVVGDDNLRTSTIGRPDPDPQIHPPTAAACVAVASCDPSEIESSEAAAIRIFGAVEIWKTPIDKESFDPPAHNVWELLPLGGVVRSKKISFVQHRMRIAVETAKVAIEAHDLSRMRHVSEEIRQEEAALAKSVEERTYLRVSDLSSLRWWSLARELDLMVPGRIPRDHGLGHMPKNLRGKRFKDLPDFAADVMAIACSGFAMLAFGNSCTLLGPRATLPAFFAEAQTR